MLQLRIHERVCMPCHCTSRWASQVGRVRSTHRVYHLLDAQDVAMLQLRVHEGVLHTLPLAHDVGLVLDLLVHVQFSVLRQPSPVLEQRRERPVGDARRRYDVANVLQARQTRFSNLLFEQILIHLAALPNSIAGASVLYRSCPLAR